MNSICNFIKNNKNEKKYCIKWDDSEYFSGDFIELKISLYIKSKLLEYLGNDIKNINHYFNDDNIINGIFSNIDDNGNILLLSNGATHKISYGDIGF